MTTVDTTTAPDAAAAAAIASLDRACTWLHVRVRDPADSHWIRLDHLASEPSLGLVRARIHPHTAGIGGVAAAALTTWLGYALTWVMAGAPYLTRRRLMPLADQLWVGLHPDEFWIDRIAVASNAAWEDITRDSAEDAAAGTAQSLMSLLSPIVEALVRQRLLGRRALWGSVADAVSYQALAMAEAAGAGADVGMRLAERLLYAIPARVQSPTWMTIERGSAVFTTRIKQSCCLAYKTPGRGWCTTCPLADEATRAAALEDWLAETAARPTDGS